MLRFKISEDKKSIKLVHFDLNRERNDLFSFFKKKSKKADFNKMVTRGIWDGFDRFITKDGVINISLWKEIYNFAEKYGHHCELEGSEELVNFKLSRASYLKYVEALFENIFDERGYPIVPRDYQIEGAFRAIKYRFCTQELATSAGKTLIFFIYNSFLRDGGKLNSTKKSLIIVPNVSLVSQTAEKFKLYAQLGKEWKVCTIGGKDRFTPKSFNDSEIVISTYQSLINLPPETFKVFSIVQVDEVHKGRSASIRDILSLCTNWEYRLGLSGTVKLEEEFSDFFRVQETVGPLVMVLSAKYLIDQGYSPNIEIRMTHLNYPPNLPQVLKYLELKQTTKSMYKDPKDFGRDMLAIEKGIIFESQERLEYISSLAKGLGKNTLILFSDVKNGYGKKIHAAILEWNEKTFYIDGEVESTERDRYKEVLESQEGVIIVSSFGTFATGIDSKNLFHIIFAESIKAEITLRQAIGRGMRKLAEKNKVVVWDLVDELEGYSVKHSKVREEIYREQKFEVSQIQIDLDKPQLYA